MIWQNLYKKMFALFEKEEEQKSMRRSNEKNGTWEGVMEATSHRILQKFAFCNKCNTRALEVMRQRYHYMIYIYKGSFWLHGL